MNKIKLIVGLGNPGKKYEQTRHNAGFLFIEELKNYFKIKNIKTKIIIAKSQSFMNESGKAIYNLIKFYKLKPENILVVHDDIDIEWGNFKFSFGRHSAGHRGVESIIKSLKTKNFWRLRIGIQPRQKTRTKADKIILKKFSATELKFFKQTAKQAILELEVFYFDKEPART